MKKYKYSNGSVCFPALFGIASSNRLPQLSSLDISRTAAILTVALTGAMESVNLARPMSPVQIMDLTETLIDTSHEDNLSLEDVMIFLQKLTRGEYGPLYESMDVAKFMEKFEHYRETRWQESLRFREEENQFFKNEGNKSRLPVLDDLTIKMLRYEGALQNVKTDTKERSGKYEEKIESKK